VGEQPGGADIVEQGGRPFRLSGGWRPTRGAAVLAVAALAAGLAAGYTAGDRHTTAGVPRATPTPSATARPASSGSGLAVPATAFSFADSPALTQDVSSCSAQHGRELQLGVQVSNLSQAPLTLKTVKAVTPLGGLRQVTGGEWAPCGTLPAGLVRLDGVLPAGQSTWLSVTFQVKVACPTPYPVQFTVGYLVKGRQHTASLPGFPDLGQVPYTGCPTQVVGAVAQSTIVIDPATGVVAP
jgi:hypothetical protein